MPVDSTGGTAYRAYASEDVVTGEGERMYETSLPGVFAIGDVRAGSVKRVASAVGEGSVVIQQVHRYLEEAHAAELRV